MAWRLTQEGAGFGFPFGPSPPFESEELMSDKHLGELRAEFKFLTGKAPSPRLDAAGVEAKIVEYRAANPDAPAFEAKPAAEAKAPAEKPAKAAKPAAEKPAAKAAAKADKAPEGCIYLKHPEGIGASYGGAELVADKSGRVLAPAGALAELEAHGFEAV